MTGDEEMIDAITAIRARNNHLWMGYVRLAFKYAPNEARALQRKITENDLQISEISAKLGENE